jgi:diguanylate cyclase (GGDEF)-like protein
MRFTARRSLRTRLLTFAAVMVALLGMVQVRGALLERVQTIRTAEGRLLELAQQAANQESQGLHDVAALLTVLARMPDVRTADGTACHELLQTVANQQEHISAIRVMDASGGVNCSNLEQAVASVVDPGWLQAMDTLGAPMLETSAVAVSPMSGQPVIVIGMRIPQSPLDVRGNRFISAELNLNWFSEMAERLSGSEGAVVSIIDAHSGIVLARSRDPQHWIGASIAGTPMLQAFGRFDRPGFEAVDLDGIARVFASVPLPVAGAAQAVVLVGLQETAVLADANARLAAGLGLAALTALLAMLACWWLVQDSILRPLAALRRVADRLGCGELTARMLVVEMNAPEFRALGLALNAAAWQLEMRERRLSDLAISDALTGIPNRRRFDEVLPIEWRRARRYHATLALAMVDVDYFKAYNDKYGHQAGDHCLRLVTTAVDSALRRPGDFVARYGGEEIVVIMPATDIAGAQFIAERIRQAVRNLAVPHVGSELGVVTVSVGFAAIRPPSNPSSEFEHDGCMELLQAADTAMYAAKRSGRDNIVAAVAARAD